MERKKERKIDRKKDGGKNEREKERKERQKKREEDREKENQSPKGIMRSAVPLPNFCNIGRNSVHPYVCPYVHPPAHPLIGWSNRPSGRTYGSTEFLPILLPFETSRHQRSRAREPLTS